MDTASLLIELYGRIPPLARASVDGVATDKLTEPPARGANTIGWLIWHVARVQDHHVSELLDTEQLWLSGPWASEFGLEPDPLNTGYGHTPDEVQAVRPTSCDALLGYLDAAAAQTASLLESLSAGDLDRIVDQRWDPPVTMGVRLVSIADDGLQHVGQAAYLRGMLDLEGTARR